MIERHEIEPCGGNQGSGTGARYRRGYRRDVTTPDDTPSLSSEEMIRRARENLATPLEEPFPRVCPHHTAPIQKTAPPQKPASPTNAHRNTNIAATWSKRTRCESQSAIMVVIALIGVGVAILVTSVPTAP